MTQTVRIVTDTTATLPVEYTRAHNIEVAAQIVVFGQETFFEGKTIAFDEFLRRLKQSPELPKTAAPQLGDFVSAYNAQLEHAKTVLSIHPSSEVSGTVRSAIAAKESEFPNADIRIVDTRTVGGNLATMVVAATTWAEQGISADEIVAGLNKLIPRSRLYFVVATLENLQKGGRIGGASALIGTALQIKPILQLKDGRVEPLEKVRTHQRALERLKELVVEQCPRSADAFLCVMQADAMPLAEKIAADLSKALGFANIPIYSMSATITTHAGPGTVGVGFFV